MIAVSSYSAIEHGTSRGGRWLRERRLKIAIGIAVVEGILVAFDVIDKWVAFAAALAVLAFYVAYARASRSTTIRDVSWIAAASQVMVALVPALILLLTGVAILAIVAVAVVALIFLLQHRR